MSKLDELENEGYIVGSSENAIIIYPNKIGIVDGNPTIPMLNIHWQKAKFKAIVIDYDIQINAIGTDTTKEYTAAAGIGLSKVIVYTYNPLDQLLGLMAILQVFQTFISAL